MSIAGTRGVQLASAELHVTRKPEDPPPLLWGETGQAPSDRVRIRGGRPLSGRLRVSGAKNAAVALLPACLLARDGVSELAQVPDIVDVDVVVQILEQLGATLDRAEGTVRVGAAGPIADEVPYDQAKRVRASSLFLGALIARNGRAVVPLPGGCDIGPRPIDLHLKGLAELGAEVRVERGYVIAQARKLVGSEIYLDFPSVGATENLMMAATAASGTTVIYNAAKEPEVVDLANFLVGMGARVVGAGTDLVRIQGGLPLHATSYTIIPDRIEAGTYLLASLASRGEIVLENVIPKHLESLLAKLEEAGVQIEVGLDSLRASLRRRPSAISVKTLPYPGFPTDLQPQLSAFLLTAEGTSIVTERVFEDRFRHIDELKRMGAQIKTESRTAVIMGVPQLSGAPVTATDLRTGAALVIAGLSATGETTVDGFRHVRRGYARMVEKLASLGADIRYD
ncbi:UDP-N-acetylglucosamine 1-carboxyvinyltransferase [Carboxydochorda subterranea]|uniref:UDP-N-acetylglucosamine 1-carboxyvinyltransferase n=1 Tax=Carboxydichorda subterranea TaxID=3109565 RepID=A0ABZ1BUF4_9FIRM|nr:UDP-N-acetylglucosamine 1-carboxyvinyltransferase [Limnochorda sp. L945t]WRP16419.1 UDP-N-acetylglucosamine 1-carboxyvinyltransferase [Limnochorda sp. L945t]